MSLLKKFSPDPFSLPTDHASGGYFINSPVKSIDWFKRRGKNELFSGQSDQPASATTNRSLLYGWLLIVLGCLCIIAGRLVFLQLFQGSHFSSIAEGNRVRIRDVKAPRGIIYDRTGRVFAKNVPLFSLAIIPVDVPKDPAQRRTIIEYAARLSGKSDSEVETLINEQPQYSYQPIIVNDSIEYDQAVLAEIQAAQYPGVVVRMASGRAYSTASSTPSLSHILGYIGKMNPDERDVFISQGYSLDDYVGKAGLETTYESVLKGRNGKEYVEVDALGQTKKILAQEKPIAGNALTLSIDADLQQVAEASLRGVLEHAGKTRGSIIVLDPRTGEVLAMVSLPTFDNNLFSGGISQEEFAALRDDSNHPLFNRAISGEYPPGSTFKLVMAAAGLQEGVITPQTGVMSVGGIHVGQWFFPDWKAGGHGWTTVTKAIAESVNTFFYMVGGGYNTVGGLGINRIEAYAKKFGLGKPLGIDIPSEASGFVPSETWKSEVKHEQWYIGDTYHVSIGQGDLLATPLQIATWTSFFANGGTIYKPHIVKRIEPTETAAGSDIAPTILAQHIVDDQTIATVRDGLRLAVTDGSARRLSTLPITAGAKTGTAQWSTTKPPHAWFTAFAPFENPEVVVTVLIEEGVEGSLTAVPVAYDILSWWTTHRPSH